MNHREDSDNRSIRFGIRELLFGVSLVCGFLAIGIASSFYFAICYFAAVLMSIDVVFDLHNRRTSTGLLIGAIFYVVVDLTIVNGRPDAFFDRVAFLTIVLFFPSMALLGLAILGRFGTRFFWLSIVGFVVCMLCVAFANLYIVATASTTV